MTGELPEPAGVGQVRLVRTFRLGADGGLYAVHNPTRWSDGWNVATCRKGRPHQPPAEGCACGFYAYPACTRRQPTAGQVLAVVAAQGTMEAGTRGARIGRARIEAVWLGRRVCDDLAARVRDRYPTVLITGTAPHCSATSRSPT